MKYSEFRRWLVRQGAIFKPAKGSHFRVYLNGRHGLAEKIKKDLALK